MFTLYNTLELSEIIQIYSDCPLLNTAIFYNENANTVEKID